MSLSQGQSAKLRHNSLENAFQLFDRAVNEAQAANACCAKALMNRGLVRDLLKDQPLALRDLQQAEKCDQADKDVLYNLACFYSKHHSSANSQLGLALETLEKAVMAGFRDCDLIEKDSDLATLRRDANFKDRLRRMLQQHGLFCQLSPSRN
jgi:tetratricopeptide (TPR) repeat protein